MILMRMTKSEALNADSMGLAVGVLEIILFTQLLWQIIFGRFLLIHSYILLEKSVWIADHISLWCAHLAG